MNKVSSLVIPRSSRLGVGRIERNPALNCEHCERYMGTTATTCPHCGTPRQGDAKENALFERQIREYMQRHCCSRALAVHEILAAERAEKSPPVPSLAAKPAVTAPRAPDFAELVARRAKEKKIGMAQAMSEVARERPDLYALHKHVLQRNADLRGEVDQRRRMLNVATYTADTLRAKTKC